LLDDLLDHPTAARTTRTSGLAILVYYGMAAGAGSLSLFVFDGWNTESHHSLHDTIYDWNTRFHSVGLVLLVVQVQEHQHQVSQCTAGGCWNWNWNWNYNTEHRVSRFIFIMVCMAGTSGLLTWHGV